MVALIKRRRIEIVAFERERITVAAAQMRCPVCQLTCELLTTRQAAFLVQVKPQTLRRWLSQGIVHGLRTATGRHRICRHSLFRPFQVPHSQGVLYEHPQQVSLHD